MRDEVPVIAPVLEGLAVFEPEAEAVEEPVLVGVAIGDSEALESCLQLPTPLHSLS